MFRRLSFIINSEKLSGDSWFGKVLADEAGLGWAETGKGWREGDSQHPARKPGGGWVGDRPSGAGEVTLLRSTGSQHSPGGSQLPGTPAGPDPVF